MEALATACASADPLPRLQRLFLFNNEIGDAGMRALGTAIAGGGLAALTYVYIHGNPGSDEPVNAALRQRRDGSQHAQ